MTFPILAFPQRIPDTAVQTTPYGATLTKGCRNS
jgi:hypothetical protein